MSENAFKPDRSGASDGVRHIPDPPQGGTLIFSGGTPTDAEVNTPVKMWNNDAQPLEWKDANPLNLGATMDLMQEGIYHDMLGTIPRVSEFTPGPGDHTPGDRGWD